MTVNELYESMAWVTNWYTFEGDYILECSAADDNLYNLLLTDSEGGKSELVRNVPGDRVVYLEEQAS